MTTPASTTPDTPTIGSIPRDMLPAVKPIVAIVLMNVMWSIANGIDWDQAVASAVLFVGQWLAPEWNPPRSAAATVLGRLRPGDTIGESRDLIVTRIDG